MDFSIKILDLHWINKSEDDNGDLCLHGNIELIIGDEILDNGKDNGDWTVSVGAFRMLESLYTKHIVGEGEHLLPCCGHFMFIDEKTNKLVICGCPNGIDWSIIHEANSIKLVTAKGIETNLPFDEYKKVVFDFSDRIKLFYDIALPKKFYEEHDRKCYERFWKEWYCLRNKKIY